MHRVAAILGLLLAYGAGAAPLMGVPLRWDETAWPPQAGAILRRGVPKVLFSEERYLYPPGSGALRWDANYGLWHPPGFAYALALSVSVLGDDVRSLRLFGLICGSVSLVLLFFLTAFLAERRGWTAGRATLAASLAGLMTALNPFWIHGSLHCDIDSTVLLLGELSWLFLFLRFEENLTLPRWLCLGGGFLLLLCLKLTTPFLLVAAVAVWLLVQSRIRDTAKLGAMTVLSLIWFGSIWMIYTRLTHLPSDFLLQNTLSRRDSISLSPFRVLNALRFNAAWISFPFCGLALTVLWKRTRDAVRDRRLSREDLPLLFALCVLVFYSTAWTHLGRYTVIVVPLVSVSIALAFLPKSWAELSVPGTVAVLFFILAAAYHGVVVPDIVVAPTQAVFPRPGTLSGGWSDPRVARYVLALVPIAAALLFLWFLPGRKHRWEAGRLGTVLALVMLPANVVESLHLRSYSHETNLLTPSESRGFPEIVRELEKRMTPDDIVIASSEVAYYLRAGRIMATDGAQEFPVNPLGAVLQGPFPRPTYLVLDESRATLPVDFPELRTFFDPCGRFGDYSLWRIRS